MAIQEPSICAKPIPVSLIESLCQCQVCYMTFNETTRIAQLLHCGHTFCQECIGNIQKYGNSAHLECPTCRAETKCDSADIAPNFLAMEIIRKFGMMGGDEQAEVKEPKRARAAQRERTIDELMDEKYRQLIADVKGELMAKFEELREGLRKSTIHSVQSELEDLSESVMDAVREAYDGMSDTEDDCDDDAGNHDEDDGDEDESEDTDSTVTSFSTAKSYQTADERSSSSVVVIENPIRQSTIDLSGDESDDEENDDDSDGMSIDSTSMESGSWNSTASTWFILRLVPGLNMSIIVSC